MTRMAVLAAAAVAMLCCVVAAPAGAATNQVTGLQSPGAFGPCTDPAASLTMTGGLVGCWYEDTFDLKKGNESASGKYQLIYSGTEHFTGCLDTDDDGQCSGDPTGTLYFTFTFTTQVDALTLAEIRGRCHHPIVAGTGDFAGATGVLNFKDDVSNPAFVTSPYMGHISF
jgi:hypothetical protein